MIDVIKVFVVYIHVTFSNGCVVHASIMGPNTKWKFTKCEWKCCEYKKWEIRGVEPNERKLYGIKYYTIFGIEKYCNIIWK